MNDWIKKQAQEHVSDILLAYDKGFDRAVNIIKKEIVWRMSNLKTTPHTGGPGYEELARLLDWVEKGTK